MICKSTSFLFKLKCKPHKDLWISSDINTSTSFLPLNPYVCRLLSWYDRGTPIPTCILDQCLLTRSITSFQDLFPTPIALSVSPFQLNHPNSTKTYYSLPYFGKNKTSLPLMLLQLPLHFSAVLLCPQILTVVVYTACTHCHYSLFPFVSGTHLLGLLFWQLHWNNPNQGH